MLHLFKKFSEQLIAPEAFVKKRYATFQYLLAADRAAHLALAHLEKLYYDTKAADINRARILYRELAQQVKTMIDALFQLTPNRYKNIADYYRKIDFYARYALAPPKCKSTPPYILPILGSYPDDTDIGGKGFHLSQLAGDLGLPVPEGFIIGTSGFNLMLEHNNLREKLRDILADVDISSPNNLQAGSAKIGKLLAGAQIPPSLGDAIKKAVADMVRRKDTILLAVRSSGVGEDSTLSFAGQYTSLLKVKPGEVLEAYRQVLISKYSPQALLYRIMNGIDDDMTPMAVIVLEMVASVKSGVVACTFAPNTGHPLVSVHWVDGLGDSLMSGQQTPATLTLRKDRNLFVTNEPPGEGSPPPKQLTQLAQWAEQIAAYYQAPQEIEWSSNDDGQIFLLQARGLKPTDSAHDTITEETLDIANLSPLYSGGQTASGGICSGPAFILEQFDQLELVPDGAVLITETTPPALVTLLPRLAGVVASQGSCADHFASVAREFQVPLLVGTGRQPTGFVNGEDLTLLAHRQQLFKGRLKGCEQQAKKLPPQTSPLYHCLHMVIKFTSPLGLVNPASKEFCPENCRSLHDIIRFCHEKAVQGMFFQSADNLLRKPKGLRLVGNIPLQMFVIDVGGGLQPSVSQETGSVQLEQLICRPLRTLWEGLSHEGINWNERAAFDWKSYDAVALAGGISAKDDNGLSSFALISSHYLNVNIRFGYHFTLLDCFCSDTAEENYILLRFAGGGGSEHGKDLRLVLLVTILTRLNFICENTGELLDARLMKYGKLDTLERLELVGRLLGAARQLDMVIRHEEDIVWMAEEFFRGRYNFFKE